MKIWRVQTTIQRIVLLGTLFTSLVSSAALASLPDRERSLESCRSSLEILSGQHYRGFSSSILIPLGRLLATRQLEYLTKLHVLGEIQSREHPTPGLAQMFLTASSAADALISHLDEVAVKPKYLPGDIVQGAVETLTLMISQQPKYIRDAVLIRDGVVMVIPLLERLEKGSFPDQKPLYRPVIVKGHQELEDTDILAAAFAAWALAGEDNLGRLPESARIFLKPMAEKRNLRLQESPSAYESFNIHVRDHLPEVERLHSRYVQLISNPQELEKLPIRRNIAATKSPWFPYMRQLMAEEGNLTMMPYPPSETEIQALASLGITNVKQLAALSLQGPRFFEAAVQTGLDPVKLRYYVSHALAIHTQQPVVVQEYEDPFEDVDWLVHVDFEDFMERDVKSGVYLFGIELENAKSRKRSRIVKKDFIFAPMGTDPTRTITQKEVDEGWAAFLRYFPKQFGENFHNENFQITVYSHHEVTKFNQQFDIVEAAEDEFSPQEQSSRYYSSYLTSDGKVRGRLIRNKSFFRKYKDIQPEDIFALLDKVVDLLPYIRWNFSFPTHTNSLKYILDYIMPATGQVLRYPDGWNGLESIEWAKNAYQTGEEALFERIRIYNEFDIDSNYFITDFIRRHVGRSQDARLVWNEAQLAALEDVAKAADASRKHRDLRDKSELLAKIFRKPLSKLKAEELLQLEEILDRSRYLAKRREVLQSDEFTKTEKDQMLQRLKYEFSNKQKHSLIQLFERVGGYDRNRVDHEILDFIAELFLNYRLHEFTRGSIHRMIALERLSAFTKNLQVRRSGGIKRRIKVSETWLASLENLKSKGRFDDLDVDDADLNALLHGLYLSKLFESR